MSRLEPGDIIKHKAFMDVCVQVTLVGNNPDTDDLHITGVWMNQAHIESFMISTNAFPFGIICEFDIKKKNLDKWFKCLEPTAKALRDAPWESIA